MDVVQCQDRKKTEPLCLPPLLIPLTNVSVRQAPEDGNGTCRYTVFYDHRRLWNSWEYIYERILLCESLFTWRFMHDQNVLRSVQVLLSPVFFLQVRQWFGFQMNKRKKERKRHAITTRNINKNTRYEAGWLFFFCQSNQISVKCHCSLWTAWNQTHFASQPEQNVGGLKDSWLIRPKMKRVIYQIWI